MYSTETRRIHGRYSLQEPLGAGAMGVVYRAIDHLTGMPLALKCIGSQPDEMPTPSPISDRERSVKLAREFEILAGLRHPHIIPVLDYGFDDEPFFTMPIVAKGQDFRQALKNAEYETQLRLFIQVLQALHYLHRRGILHRDLKPSNILVTPDNLVYVLDFGLAILADKTADFGGTLAYTAPELLQGGQASVTSDLYAFGVLAYQILTGAYPFDVRADMHALSQEILLNQPDLAPVPDEVRTLIGALLAKEPHERPHDAVIVMQEFSNLLSEPIRLETHAMRESFLQANRFVGREDELNKLRRALATLVARKTGNGCLIGGESGVGKTRLLEEFRIRALVQKAQVLRGRAIEEGGFPYHLWREPLRRLALTTPISDEEAGILKEIVPDIDTILGREVQPAPQLSSGAASRLQKTIRAIFKRQETPTVLILEDLQWTVESLEILKTLQGLLDEIPLMIVGSFRNDEAPHLPDELPAFTAITLNRIDETDIQTLSESMLGQAGASADLVSLLHRETEGNLFFLVEVVRALAEEAGSLEEVTRASLPQSVLTGGMEAILRRRIGRISGEYQPLLRLAAVAGRQLDPDVLISAAPQGDYDGLLYDAEAAAVFDIEHGNWQFSHDKLRQAVLAEIPSDERASLHRQIATAIETVYPEDPSYHEVLLDHWHQADDLAKEIFYLEFVAGDLIVLFTQLDVAQEKLTRTLDRLEVDDPRAIPLLNWQAEAFYRQGNYTQARIAAETARVLAEHHQATPALARATFHLGSIAHLQGEYPQAREHYEDAHALVEENQMELARIYNNLGLTADKEGKYDEARTFHEASLTLAQQINDQYGIARSYNNLALLADQQGDQETAQDAYLQALDMVRAIGNLYGEGYILNNLGILTMHLDDFDASEDYHRQSLAIKEATNDRYGMAFSYNNLGSLAYMRGDFDTARELLEKALQLQLEIGDQQGAAACRGSLTMLAVRQDDPQATTRLHEALDDAYKHTFIPVVLHILCGCAELAGQHNDPDFGTQILAFIESHTAYHTSVAHEVDRIRPVLQAALTVADFQQANTAGQNHSLDDVVNEVLKWLDTAAN